MAERLQLCHGKTAVFGNIDEHDIHPGRLTWNLKITYLKRKIIFQTSIIMFQSPRPSRTRPVSGKPSIQRTEVKSVGTKLFRGFQHKVLGILMSLAYDCWKKSPKTAIYGRYKLYQIIQ